MAADEDPTPRQTGSYGIMADICTSSKKRLLELLACPCDTHQHRDYTTAVNRFTWLLEQINLWPQVPPTPEQKRDTIALILATRAEAELLVARYGAKF